MSEQSPDEQDRELPNPYGGAVAPPSPTPPPLPTMPGRPEPAVEPALQHLPAPFGEPAARDLPAPAVEAAAGAGTSAGADSAPVVEPVPAGPPPNPGPRRIRIHHLREMKDRGEKFAMLTAYDQYAAGIFEEAGIPVLLVGDSAANNVLGYETTVPVTVEELLPLVRAVARTARRPLVVADLPFGSYQSGPEQALATSMRMMKEGLAHAVKLEGGRRIAASVEQVVGAGIPVMAHVGFTPQSEHALGGYRVQGRGESGVAALVADALALEAAGAFAIVLEMVPAPAAAEVTKALTIPTIGIGAGPDCDGQVLVWQDMMGLRTGRAPRFVKRYADLHAVMLDAAQAYADDVRSGSFPAAEHSFDS